MTILALILRWLGVADVIIPDVLQVIQHAQNATNVQAAQAHVKASTLAK
jgi:hypothetical protein